MNGRMGLEMPILALVTSIPGKFFSSALLFLTISLRLVDIGMKMGKRKGQPSFLPIAWCDLTIPA